VDSQLAVLPACQSFKGANPERPVARGEQANNKAAGELLTRWHLPRNGPDTIEAQQAEFSTEPEITVGRLGNGGDPALGKAGADLPRGVRVLADVELGIQRERARTCRQQHDSQQNAQRDNVWYSSVRSRHSA